MTVTLELADTFLEMDESQRARFVRSRTEEELADLEHAVAARSDPLGTRVYRSLGYEPICIPRVQAALDAGYRNPLEAEFGTAAYRALIEPEDGQPLERADKPPLLGLPPACGRCPAERFDQADEFDVLFGGAAGGSKTKSSIMFGVRCMARWPGFRALFLRETYDELDENVFPELRAIDYAEAIGGHWNAGRKQLDIGASVMRFRYMGELSDVLRRRGGSYQLVLLDERNQLPTGVADGLRDRLRSADASIPVVGIRSTANPGGRSHGELKSKYVRPDPREHKTNTDEHGDVRTFVRQGTASWVRRFIPAKATDNPYLGPDYEEQVLGGIEDPTLRAAMRDGDWDKFTGQYFGEWSYARHVVPAGAVELQRAWPRFEGIDYGRAAPFCMLRGALDGDRRLWLYAEVYESGLGESDQARRILQSEAAWEERRVYRFGDPSMWGKVSDADPIAETYRKLGVSMEPANNDRVSGWARVHTYLEEMPPCPYHAALGWETCPKLHVIEGSCPNFVRTLPDLPFDKNRVEDLDTDSEDHAADAFRYLVMHARPRRRAGLAGQQQRAASASSV